MRFCRNHPCFGWLSLEPQDYRFVYNKLIEMRDADLKAGDNSSGFPSGFEDWALSHLEELAKQQTYKKRIADHLDQMNLVIANREKELQNTYLVQELDKLKDRKQLIESFI
tara:strand:+ start:486 stop:818 length:333 start_codon:yes stop_codon:yes gene_type:complete